jgi:hypothetical protein
VIRVRADSSLAISFRPIGHLACCLKTATAALCLGFEKKFLLQPCWPRACVSLALGWLWMFLRFDEQLPWLDESALCDSDEPSVVDFASLGEHEA